MPRHQTRSGMRLDSLSVNGGERQIHRLQWSASVHPIHYISRSHRLKPRFQASSMSQWYKSFDRVDINRYVAFSWIRCALSLASLTLLISDVPRSGLGVRSISEFYSKHTAPDTVAFFTPEPYPIVHITCSHISGEENEPTNDKTRNCTASDAHRSITELPAWYYGFDSTSIALRGFVELFQIPSFPEFLLERGSDPRIHDPYATINIYSTFQMLDSVFAGAFEAMNSSNEANSASTLWFASRYRWIDRLHHFVMPFNVQNYRWRLNSLDLRVFSPAQASTFDDNEIQICAHPSERRSGFHLFTFCDHFIDWKCENPVNNSLGKISARNHLAIRLRNLRHQYPNMTVETIFLSSEETSATSSILSRAIMDSLEVAEVVVLTRGRSCTDNGCVTAFVDDYRYERRLITTTATEWYGVTAGLRGTAQIYVWTRLGCLFYVAYCVQPAQYRSTICRLQATLLSIIKIPFHTIVYGSLIPIVLYVIAYFVDAWFIEYKLDTMWTTIKDNYSSVNKFEFMRMCTMQMRNVWVLALLAKIAVFLQTRDSRWRPHMGIRGVRGLAIGLASMLSIFGPFRSLWFRSSTIVELVQLGGMLSDARFTALKIEPGLPINKLLLPVGWSQVMTAIAILVMLAVEVVMAILSWKIGKEFSHYELLYGYSIFVPHTAGTLWPITALAVRFHLNSVMKADGRFASADPAGHFVRSKSQTSPQRHRELPSGDRSPASSVRTKSVGNRWRHSMSINDRSGGTRAVVQLMNICMMSDPWTLFRLRIIGMDLFVYRIRSMNCAGVGGARVETYYSILPYSPIDVTEWTGLKREQFACVAEVNSNELPLWMLIQSG